MRDRTDKDDKRVKVEGGGSEDARRHERDRATTEKGIKRDKREEESKQIELNKRDKGRTLD